jgi:hypothetical protein
MPLDGASHHCVDDLVLHFRDFDGRGANGCHPAIIRACSHALALSVMPGNNRRTSIAADSSPSCLKTVRIAAASASVTTNMAEI